MLIGPMAHQMTNSDGSPTIAIAGEVTVYTKSFKISWAEFFGLAYQAASTGSPNLKIELEQGYAEPGTEGSSDDDWVTPTGVSAIESALTAKTRKMKNLSPIPMPYIRFKITGLTGNPADVTLDLRLGVLENY